MFPTLTLVSLVPALLPPPALALGVAPVLVWSLILALSLPLALSLTWTLALRVPSLLALFLTVGTSVSELGSGLVGFDTDSDPGFLDASSVSCLGSSSDCAFVLSSGSDSGPGPTFLDF